MTDRGDHRHAEVQALTDQIALLRWDLERAKASNARWIACVSICVQHHHHLHPECTTWERP